MNPPESVEDLKKYILREIPKTRFIDFGLLYENDKGEYVVLNDVRMADIRLASLVYLLVHVSTYCVPIALLRQNKPFRLLYLGVAQITKWNSKPPSPQIKAEAAQKPKRAIFPSLIWGDWGRRYKFAIYFVQHCRCQRHIQSVFNLIVVILVDILMACYSQLKTVKKGIR